MIQLDIDLAYLTKHFEIGTKRINDVRNKTLEEIMKAEASTGNSKAANFDLAILKNPLELAKLLKLTDPRNRWKILKNMTENDLQYLLKFLEDKDLLLGMQFFTKEKLLNMTQSMPKKKLALVTFSKFPPQKFLQMMPERELDKFFDSSKVTQGVVLKAMKKMPPAQIAEMLEGALNMPMKGKSKGQMLGMMSKLSPDVFKDTIKAMEPDHKKELILKIVKDDPKFLLEFSQEALAMPLTQLQKPDLVKAFEVLDPKDLAQMVAELPKDLLSVVCSQIDPKVFSEVLCDKFQDILSKVAIGN